MFWESFEKARICALWATGGSPWLVQQAVRLGPASSLSSVNLDPLEAVGATEG